MANSRKNAGKDSGSALRPWPADKVERWPLERIVPYPRNPRTHDEAQIVQLAASMERFGVTAPVLVDEAGLLIYGHGRRMAAERLARAGQAAFSQLPVVVARGWTEDEKRAYRIADNQLALLADWDMPMLKLEIGDLKLAGFDIPLLGFDKMEIVQFLANPMGADPDEDAGKPPLVPVVRRGELWRLGDHRLLCGDATKTEDVERVLAGVKPHLMVTDPPYGVDYDPMWRNRVKRSDGTLVGAKATGIVYGDASADWNTAWRLFEGDVAYVWHGGMRCGEVQQSLIAAGLIPRTQIIWAKERLVIGRGDYHWQHEPCWYAVRKGKSGGWVGDRKQTTIWTIGAPSGPDAHQGIHSTQKPIECMKRPIENNSSRGDVVYDPFVGSGTTIVAAELTARRCLAMELDPGYAEVAMRRWEKIAQRAAVLEETGEPLSVVAMKRALGSP
jgi:DNA modification methylase